MYLLFSRSGDVLNTEALRDKLEKKSGLNFFFSPKILSVKMQKNPPQNKKSPIPFKDMRVVCQKSLFRECYFISMIQCMIARKPVICFDCDCMAADCLIMIQPTCEFSMACGVFAVCCWSNAPPPQFIFLF